MCEQADDNGALKDEAGQRMLYCLLAEYETPGSLVMAAEAVRKAGYTRWDAHSPFPVDGIEPAMGMRKTSLPWIVFIAGRVLRRVLARRHLRFRIVAVAFRGLVVLLRL